MTDKCMTAIIWIKIDHFLVSLCLCFKASLSEKPFLWKWLWFAWKWNCVQNSFSYERFALRLVLKQRHKRTRKWPVKYAVICCGDWIPEMLGNRFRRAIGSPRIFELFQPPQALQFSQSISANQNSKWPQQNAVTLAFIHVLIGQRMVSHLD